MDSSLEQHDGPLRSPPPASGRSQACADCVHLSALERWGGVGGFLRSPDAPPTRGPRHVFGLNSKFVHLVMLALFACLIGIDAYAAPLPSQLGPEVAITRPRDGYVGRLNVAPE